MATFTKTPEGAYFMKGEAGLQAVNDIRTLQGLYGGTIPYENSPSLGTVAPSVANVPAPSNFNPTLTNTGQAAAPIAPRYQAPENNADPLTKFNLSLMDMLHKAQAGSGNDSLNLYQQRALQAQHNAIAQQTPQDLTVLSPGAQESIRQSAVSAFTPGSDLVAAEIKSRDSRLQNFERILGTMRDMGTDLAKLNPSKEVIEGYRKVIRAGGDITSIPSEIRNSVLTGLTDDDYNAGRIARITEATGKKGTGTTSGTGVYVEGQNPSVDGYIKQIRVGRAKLSDVPKELKGLVVQGLGFTEDDAAASDKFVNDALDIVESLLSPERASALASAVGPISSRLPTISGDTSDVESDVRRLRAILTKDNLKLMKGLGSMNINEFENLKAIADSLETTRSEGGFKAELERIQQNLHRQTTPITSTANTSSGVTSSGLKYTIEPTK